MRNVPTAALHNVAELIETREDLVSFLVLLRSDLISNPEKWENDTLPTFLEALTAWTREMEGYFLNQHAIVPESPSWRLIASMLLAARIYE